MPPIRESPIDSAQIHPALEGGLTNVRLAIVPETATTLGLSRVFFVGLVLPARRDIGAPIIAPISRRRDQLIDARSRGASMGPPRMWSAAFSATMIVGALVLEEGIRGMTEESQTRSPSIPRNFRSGPTIAMRSDPIAQ